MTRRELGGGCLLCGGRVAVDHPSCTAMLRPLFTGSSLVACAGCGLRFLYPVPSNSQLAGVYEEEYFAAYARAGIPLPAEAGNLPERHRDRLQALERTRGAGRLLDVGVGDGAFLHFAQSRGWACQGVEVSAYAAKRARERYGVEIRCGTMEDVGYPSDYFDVVHLSHVLEHLPDPLRALREILRVLRPGGVLIVEVPNELENLQARLAALCRVSRAPYVVPSTHLFFFTPETLRRALNATGYLVRTLRTARDTGDASLARRVVKRLASVVEQPLRMGPLVEATGEKPATLEASRRSNHQAPASELRSA